MKDISEKTDEEIIEIVRKKDKEVYREIIKRYEDKLTRYVGYLVSDEAEAADVVQETFIKAYIYINSFNTRKKFSSWIYRIAHNGAMNELKKNKKKVPMEGVELDSGTDLEKEFIVKELKEDAHNCLKKMQVIYSEPLTLYFLEDKTYEEISDILRIPTGTVGARISRGKAVMKKICQRK
jgi:RNA polymerase sigma-70 factor (ECF subfamily)